MSLNVETIINNTTFSSIPSGTKVADLVITGSDSPVITNYSNIYTVSTTEIITTTEVTPDNLLPFNFKVEDSSTGESKTITNIYPKVVSSLQYKFIYPNGIYKITTDLDLKGCIITIPAESCLDFQGGIISNGVIIGTRSSIKAGLHKIIDNIIFQGTWNVVEAYPQWFGAIIGTISTASFLALLSSPFKNIVIPSGEYRIGQPLPLSDGVTIKGASSSQSIIPATILNCTFPNSDMSLFISENPSTTLSNISVSALTVRGQGSIRPKTAFELVNVKDVSINNVVIMYFYNAIDFNGATNIKIDDLQTKDNIYSTNYITNNSSNISFSNSSFADRTCCIKADSNMASNIMYDNCLFTNGVAATLSFDLRSNNDFILNNPYIYGLMRGVFSLGESGIDNNGVLTINGGCIAGSTPLSTSSSSIAFNMVTSSNLIIYGTIFRNFNKLLNITAYSGNKNISFDSCILEDNTNNNLIQPQVNVVNVHDPKLGKVYVRSIAASGVSTNKPTLSDSDVGSMYYSTNSSPSFIVWNGVKWKDSLGYNLAVRAGSLSNRPTNLEFSDVGFTFYDYTTHILYIWDGSSWRSITPIQS